MLVYYIYNIHTHTYINVPRSDPNGVSKQTGNVCERLLVNGSRINLCEAFRAKYFTPELTTIEFHSKIPPNIHMEMSSTSTNPLGKWHSFGTSSILLYYRTAPASRSFLFVALPLPHRPLPAVTMTAQSEAPERPAPSGTREL